MNRLYVRKWERNVGYYGDTKVEEYCFIKAELNPNKVVIEIIAVSEDGSLTINDVPKHKIVEKSSIEEAKGNTRIINSIRKKIQTAQEQIDKYTSLYNLIEGAV